MWWSTCDQNEINIIPLKGWLRLLNKQTTFGGPEVNRVGAGWFIGGTSTKILLHARVRLSLVFVVHMKIMLKHECSMITAEFA